MWYETMVGRYTVRFGGEQTKDGSLYGTFWTRNYLEFF